VSGYNHKLPLLANTIIQRMRNLVIKPQRFQLLKENLVRQYLNYNLEMPVRHALNLNTWFLEPNWSIEDKLTQLGLITVEDAQAHVETLFRSVYLTVLVHGNMVETEVRDLVEQLKSELKANPLPCEQIPECRVVNLQPKKSYIGRFRNRNPTDINSAVGITFQVGESIVPAAARLTLTAHIASTPFFDILRTNEQLGYLVNEGASSSSGVLYCRMYIQSSNFDADYCDSRAEAFLLTYRDTLAAMDEKTFEANKAAVIATYLIKDKTLLNETQRLWTEIANRRYCFDRKLQIVAELKTLTLQDVLDFWDEHLSLTGNRRKLSIRYFGGQHAFMGADGKEVSSCVETPAEESTDQAEAAPVELAPAPADPYEPVLLTTPASFIRKSALYPCFV
jgi:insulysin